MAKVEDLVVSIRAEVDFSELEEAVAKYDLVSRSDVRRMINNALHSYARNQRDRLARGGS